MIENYVILVILGGTSYHNGYLENYISFDYSFNG